MLWRELTDWAVVESSGRWRELPCAGPRRDVALRAGRNPETLLVFPVILGWSSTEVFQTQESFLEKLPSAIASLLPAFCPILGRNTWCFPGLGPKPVPWDSPPQCLLPPPTEDRDCLFTRAGPLPKPVPCSKWASFWDASSQACRLSEFLKQWFWELTRFSSGSWWSLLPSHACLIGTAWHWVRQPTQYLPSGPGTEVLGSQLEGSPWRSFPFSPLKTMPSETEQIMTMK